MSFASTELFSTGVFALSSRIHLTFAIIDAFDPQGPPSRRLCPLCGVDKPRDGAHRSLSLDRVTGLWKCFRCGEAGKVEEKWEDKSPHHARDRARQNLREAFSLVAPIKSPERADTKAETPTQTSQIASESSIEPEFPVHEISGQDADTENGNYSTLCDSTISWDWRDTWEKSVEIVDTPGEKYLSNRALCATAMSTSRTRFCPSWSGRPSVVFPIHDRRGELVAVQGRAISGDAKRTFGPKKEGAFFAPVQIEGRLIGPLDTRVPAVVLVEAPIDALSLASCGFPALALCGTTGPSWLHIACGLRRVSLAFDADDAGECAAEKLAITLERFGARCERMRPQGFKDWNDVLYESGRDELVDWLASRIL